jgi:hypothetical protein
MSATLPSKRACDNAVVQEKTQTLSPTSVALVQIKHALFVLITFVSLKASNTTKSLKTSQMITPKMKGEINTKKDPRVSPKTGKRVPDFIILPDISFLTNMNYTAPCNDTSSCSVWFCTKFLRGPVARIEKLYNPQDSSDDNDTATTALYAGGNSTNGTSARLLQSSSADSSISETGGVDFNLVASQSGLSSSVSIDGVDVAADAYVDNNGNFGVRMTAMIALLMVIIMVVL